MTGQTISPEKPGIDPIAPESELAPEGKAFVSAARKYLREYATDRKQEKEQPLCDLEAYALARMQMMGYSEVELLGFARGFQSVARDRFSPN